MIDFGTISTLRVLVAASISFVAGCVQTKPIQVSLPAPNQQVVTCELADSGSFRVMREGNQLAAKNQWKAAEALWNEAARKRPNDAGVWYNLGIAAEVRGDRRLAIQRYFVARQIDETEEDYRGALHRINESLRAEQRARQDRRLPSDTL